MITRMINAIRNWWERHICAEFPYEDQCFTCNEGDCTGCSITN